MTRQRQISFLFSISLVVGHLTSCGPTDASPTGISVTDEFVAAEQAVIAAVAEFDYAGFTKINTEIFTTTHGASSHANVWVSNDHVNLYRELDPADTTSTHEEFPEGMTVIKEQVNADGTSADSLLVMSKFADGYNDGDNNWWWGLFTNASTPSNDIGVVGFCIDCHVSSDLVRTDYMLGVENDNHAE